jgi:hypothetical protein
LGEVIDFVQNKDDKCFSYLYLFQQFLWLIHFINRIFKNYQLMKKLTNLFMATIMVASFSLSAQIVTPQPSPMSTLKQKVGLTDVTVDYSRPSAKGRTIYGAGGIVPNGEIWRTGANQATKIEFSTDVMVEGKELKKGAYAILTKPDAAAWAVHFYSYTGGNFGDYVEKVPTAAVMVTPTKSSAKFETFTVNIDNITNTGAHLQLIWENTIVPIKISADSDKSIMASIDKTLAGPTGNDYYNAASYLHDSGKDLSKALEYVQKATKVASPAFWQVRKESLILADLGRKAEAIEAAKKSLELAKAANNADYIRMNEKSIADWMKK